MTARPPRSRARSPLGRWARAAASRDAAGCRAPCRTAAPCGHTFLSPGQLSPGTYAPSRTLVAHLEPCPRCSNHGTVRSYDVFRVFGTITLKNILDFPFKLQKNGADISKRVVFLAGRAWKACCEDTRGAIRTAAGGAGRRAPSAVTP